MACSLAARPQALTNSEASPAGQDWSLTGRSSVDGICGFPTPAAGTRHSRTLVPKIFRTILLVAGISLHHQDSPTHVLGPSVQAHLFLDRFVPSAGA